MACSRMRTRSSSRWMKRGRWAGNISGTYRLPYNVSVSGFLQSKSGVKGQRTNIFRTADPDGGPADRQQRQHDDSSRAVRFPESVCLQHPQLPGEQGLPHGRRPEARHRLRYVQCAEFCDSDRRRIPVGSNVRLCHWRHAAAHHAHRRAVHVLDGGSMKRVKFGAAIAALVSARRRDDYRRHAGGRPRRANAGSSIAQLRHEPVQGRDQV